MIKSCQDGLKAMYMNISFFLFSGLFSLMFRSVSCFDNFALVSSMVAARVIYVPLGFINVTLNKKGIFLRVFDL